METRIIFSIFAVIVMFSGIAIGDDINHLIPTDFNDEGEPKALGVCLIVSFIIGMYGFDSYFSLNEEKVKDDVDKMLLKILPSIFTFCFGISYGIAVGPIWKEDPQVRLDGWMVLLTFGLIPMISVVNELVREKYQKK